MSHTYTELYYHLVWATKEREPCITPDMEQHLYPFLRHKCSELRGQVYALNGMPDHVHLVCSVPPALSLAQFVERVKGASAHFINHAEALELRLYWQPGYGALTFAKRDLARVVAYVDQQKERHAAGTTSPKMERSTD